MPEISSPKEILKKVAEFQDTMFEIATKPIKDFAESLGLPTPPEPPKAQDIVESLPDLPELPAPEALLKFPGTTTSSKSKSEEVSRINVKKENSVARIKMKII